KADRILVLVAYLSGLGYANHMAGVLAVPAVGLAVLIVRPRYIIPTVATVVILGIAYALLGTSPVLAAIVAIAGLVGTWFFGRGRPESDPAGAFHSRYSVLF